MKSHRSIWSSTLLFAALAASPFRVEAQQTQKPVLHGKEWVAITGKPLGATAGAMMFIKGGNAVDAAAAMLGATATMWDVLGWGGETQALIYNPETGEVIGVNALGAAPAGATPEFFHEQGMAIPPAYGPARGRDPRHPGGAHGHARRVRPPQSRRGSGAGDRHGARLSDRSADGQLDRA